MRPKISDSLVDSVNERVEASVGVDPTLLPFEEKLRLLLEQIDKSETDNSKSQKRAGFNGGMARNNQTMTNSNRIKRR